MSAAPLALPSRARTVLYAQLLAGLTLLFCAVYFGCNWVAARRERTWGLYADWELAIPFVPAMIYGYASIGLLFALPLFRLDETRLRALAKAFALATLVAGVCFLLVPAHLGFERPTTVPGHELAYAVLFQADGIHNTVPSLHIAYSTLIVLAVGGLGETGSRPRMQTALLGAWLLLIAVSVLLVHQHHLADVAGGFALGWACHCCYRRWIHTGSRRSASARKAS